MRFFKSKLIIQQLMQDELNALTADFRQYKETGALPEYFGRDVPYDHPNTLSSVRQEEIAHLHLADDSRQWPMHRIQFNRTSDKHLVYCRGFHDQDDYLLMIILEPNAHELARDNNILYKLAQMAARFRETH